MKSMIKEKLEGHGYVLVSSKKEADLFIRIKTHFYKKMHGAMILGITLLPREILIPYGQAHWVDGIEAEVILTKDKGKWSKKYRAYFGESYLKMYHKPDKIPEAITRDLMDMSNKENQDIGKSLLNKRDVK